ncbi:uncharacterized protein [Choristoneura fumiferana]|uniref:uncharacterized protein n=1 Tax=Choristoneura fumiferana TaxID=7141 RepID=UPI003D15CEE2
MWKLIKTVCESPGKGRDYGELIKIAESAEKSSISDFKLKNHVSPTKAQIKKPPAPKKSLKLTLPKPIMHMAQPDEYMEEKIYADKFYIDNKEVVYDNRYVAQGVKYGNGLPDTKYIVDSKEAPEKYTFQHYEEQPYHDNGYVDRQEKKPLRIKYKLVQQRAAESNILTR